MKNILLQAIGIIFALFSFIKLTAQDRPNIVWIVSEDNSKHYLRLYEEGGAPMPRIEALAVKGVTFNHAFSQGPVCSVARSTLISGCYAPRIGAQYHRRMEKVPMPDGLKMFPQYLREAGYYTTNNSKEDYNIIKSENVWDESSGKATYRNRKPEQHFFHVKNFGTTHEGQLHFSKEIMESTQTIAKSESITPFPYHPDSPTYRFTYAWYHDLHAKVDQQIGAFLDQLEEDGLMENTIVFYYGDHGGVLPRSKGYIYESGVHVPLVVYFPSKWEHLAPSQMGQKIDGFVQFSDFGPTVLHLAGVKVPKQMDGKPFLGEGITGKQLDKRNTSFSYADRFDEKYDLVRAIRQRKYKYIRNYQPFNIDALFNFYRYKMLAYQEWAELFDKGKLNTEQRQFFEPRSTEALYDLSKDPHEVNNLAHDPAYEKTLKRLRKKLQSQLKSMPDLSFFPEPYFLENGIENPVEFGKNYKKEIQQLIRIADLQLLPIIKARGKIAKALNSDNPNYRYWGLIVCSTFGETANEFYNQAKEIAQNDADLLVKTRALEFLALNNQSVSPSAFIPILKQAKSETEANLILNTIALLKEVKDDFQIQIPREIFDPEWLSSEGRLVNRRLEYINGK